MAEMGELPFLPERTGSFWSCQAQVDVVAINWCGKEILLGECKWGRSRWAGMSFGNCSTKPILSVKVVTSASESLAEKKIFLAEIPRKYSF